jgi:hypothetical protein
MYCPQGHAQGLNILGMDHHATNKGGMTMHPQTKRPWSFQPWTMSLSDQNDPGLKLINGFYIPSIFGPWMLHPSLCSLFLGTL